MNKLQIIDSLLKEALGPRNIGLPTRTEKKYKTEIINGHRFKSVNKSYAGAHAGWNVWVDDNPKPYFKNYLTRKEAIEAVRKQLGF